MLYSTAWHEAKERKEKTDITMRTQNAYQHLVLNIVACDQFRSLSAYK